MIHVGIVGCGRIADLHAPGYARTRAARIYAVCDKDRALAERRRIEWGAEKAYTDFREMLADRNVDAVEILTPQKLHEPMVLAAAMARKHVALQKPMTIDLQSARRMIEAMRKSGKVFRITDNYLFYPPIVKLKHLLDEGHLGVPTNLRIKLISGGSGGWEVPASAWEWRMQERMEGRGMQTFDHGHHLFATALFLLGKVHSVHAWIDSLDGVVDSPAVIHWKYADKTCYGVCEYAHAEDLHIPSKYYANDEWFELTGTKGIAQIHRCTGNVRMGPPITVFRSDGWGEFEVEGDWGEGFLGATENFVAAMLGEEKPQLSGEDAYEVLRLSLAIQKSSRLRREVFLDEMDAAHPTFTWLSHRVRIEAQRHQWAEAGREWLSSLFGNSSGDAKQAIALTRELVARFDKNKAPGWSATIGLVLLADGGEQETRLGVVVKGGVAQVVEGGLPQDAVLTLFVPAGTWAAILLKKKRVETAYLQGTIKLEGRAEEAMKLRAAFGL